MGVSTCSSANTLKICMYIAIPTTSGLDNCDTTAGFSSQAFKISHFSTFLMSPSIAMQPLSPYGRLSLWQTCIFQQTISLRLDPTVLRRCTQISVGMMNTDHKSAPVRVLCILLCVCVCVELPWQSSSRLR